MILNSIEDTAQQFNVARPIKNGLTQVLNSIRSIQMFLDKHRQQQVVQPNKAVEQQHNYNFTGQHTDIAFCDTNGSISYEEISNISDYKLKDNVTTSFNKAVEDGYLSYENASYTLTDKGKEHISSQSFIEQFDKDQKNFIANNQLQNTVAINLQGNGDDLKIFQYVNQIDLNKLSYSNPQQFKQVQNYFEKCEKYDFVKISKDGIVTPTEKTKGMFTQPQSVNMEKITTKNFDKVIDINKYRNSVHANATKATAKASSSVAKTGATTASAGATAGVTAVIDLSKEAIKAFDKAQKLNQSKRISQSNH